MLNHHKRMVVNLHSVLFGIWNNLASNLERSAFKQRFTCCTSHSMLRLQSSPYIRVYGRSQPLKRCSPCFACLSRVAYP